MNYPIKKVDQPSILLFGAGDHARVVADIVERQEHYRIAGLICTNPKGKKGFDDYCVLGREKDLPSLMQEYAIEGGIVAIGDNWQRSEVVSRIRSFVPGFRFVCAVHPAAQLGKHAVIGAGTVVMAGAVINTGTVIGEHCIIHSGACVDHDNLIGDYVTIGPGAITGGDVCIGEHSALCLGVHIINGLRIGKHCVIGAGSTLLHNAPEFWTLYGAPARRRKPRKAGDSYLGRPGCKCVGQ